MYAYLQKINKSLGINKQKIKTPVSGLNGLSQNIEWKVKTFISNEDRSFNEKVEFLIVDEIAELNPSQTLDIANVEIPRFLNLADKSFYEDNEINALINADIFFKVLKHITYKVNDEFFFKESQFRGKCEYIKLNTILIIFNEIKFVARNP